MQQKHINTHPMPKNRCSTGFFKCFDPSRLKDLPSEVAIQHTPLADISQVSPSDPVNSATCGQVAVDLFSLGFTCSMPAWEKDHNKNLLPQNGGLMIKQTHQKIQMQGRYASVSIFWCQGETTSMRIDHIWTHSL